MLMKKRDTIVVDLVRYPDRPDCLWRSTTGANSKLDRFRLNLQGAVISQTPLQQRLLELPRISYQKYNAHPISMFMV